MQYVTGFWKADQIVALGLFQFIGPANSYTHALPIHSAITRLGWLVSFSRVSFSNNINSWLKTIRSHGGALHGRHGSEIHPSGGETSFRPSEHFWTYDWHFLDSQLVQTVLLEGLTSLRLPTLPLMQTTCNITMVVEKVAQIQLASRNSYKTLAKRLYQLYSIYTVYISSKKTTLVSIFKLGFLEIPNVTIRLVFQTQLTYVDS